MYTFEALKPGIVSPFLVLDPLFAKLTVVWMESLVGWAHGSLGHGPGTDSGQYLFVPSRKSTGGKGSQQIEITAVIYVPEIILSEVDSSNVRAERDLRGSLDQNYRFAVADMEQGERRSKVNTAGSWKARSPSLPISRNVTAACWLSPVAVTLRIRRVKFIVVTLRTLNKSGN